MYTVFLNDSSKSNAPRLEYIEGHMANGQPFFAYVMLKNPSAKLPVQTNSGLSLSPDSYVIYSDYGHEVQEDVKDYVLQEFHKLSMA